MRCSSLVPIGDFLLRSNEWVEPDPSETYKQITARLWGKGLTLRAHVPGSKIAAAKQLRARSGQFLVSRIDARHGAFGIVPKSLDGALVSNDFPCFDIDARFVAPEYFEWLSRTAGFVELCRRVSEGSTNRVRLKEGSFLNIEVPLPSLEEQRRIAERLDRMQGLIEKRHEAIAAVDADLDILLLKAFERVIADAPYRPMSEVAPLVRRPVTEIDPDGVYPELGVRSFGRGTFHKPTIQGSDITWQKFFRVEQGDLVFSNIKAWEGAFAVASEVDHSRYGSHRYLTCVPVTGIMTAQFLWYYLQSREGIEKVQVASPGSADRNRTLGQARLAAIDVPVPAIEAQHWFNRLLAKAHDARRIRERTAQDVDALSSAMLREAFAGGEHQIPQSVGAS